MKLTCYLEISLFVLATLVAGNVQAALVDFEEFVNGTPGTGDLSLQSTFQMATTTPGSQQRLEQVDSMGNPLQTFGDSDGISFFGGVLLQNPTATVDFPAAGSVLYGTANSPTTGAQTTPPGNLPRTIEINIDTSVGENITLVEGLLVNGLNTDADNPMGMPYTNELADYLISFFTDDPMTAEFVFSLPNLASNEVGGFGIFSFDSTREGDAAGNLITRVEVTSPGINFLGDNSICVPGNTNVACEYDFFIDALSFNQPLNPIPIPAALPLFLSALIGGWMFARPRKPSESIH